MQRGGPVVVGVPDEEERAVYQGGLLRLTDRRVVYMGRGLRRHQSMSMFLEDLTGVGMGWRIGVNLYFLLLPAALVLLGFVTTWMTTLDDPFFMALFAAMWITPLAFVMPTRVVRIAAPGAKIVVRVPRRHVLEAAAFLEQIEVARAQTKTARRPAEPTIPTARPYGV